MATKDGRAQIWYADGNGNVEGYTETVDDIAGTIIDAYNEHFGTDIQIWTPETKTLQVGGTVPNWNAYEKIEMPQTKGYKSKSPYSQGHYSTAIEDGDKLAIDVQAGTQLIILCDDEGIILQNTLITARDIWPRIWQNVATSKGLQDTLTLHEVVQQIGEKLDNWESYETI